MKSTLKILMIVLISFQALAQSNEVVKPSEAKPIATAKLEIKKVLQAQEIAWNQHDLEGYMAGYWKNDALKFFGSSGLTYGWETTLANYKKSYPTKAKTGKLEFILQDITQIDTNNYWVMGEYHLTRSVGDANGVFMILFRKIDDKWKIVADMSC